MRGGMFIGSGLGLDSSSGGGVPEPFPPPVGFRWEFVTAYGQRVTSASHGGEPVVALVRS